MENKFEKYYLYKRINGKIVDANPDALNLKDEAFDLFKELFDTNYGSMYEDENLIEIHTGGWSENEYLIEEFCQTSWWFLHHEITATGGHYYFDTGNGNKEWTIKAK